MPFASPPFGLDVASKSRSINYEIEEAAKCLALDRSTASAFHSIRSLESEFAPYQDAWGFLTLHELKDRNWGALLKSIKDNIEARWPGSSTRLSGDGQFFDNAYASLAATQNPWRNATIALDQVYTEQAARDIFNVVGAFMRRLSDRLDENGDPKV